MSIKQSVCLPAFKPAMARPEFFAAIKEIGFSAVEIWRREDDFDEICDLADSHDLRVCSMIGHESIAEGLNNPANHTRIEDELKASIDIAVKKNIPGVICFSGNRREGLDTEESIDICAAGLTPLIPYAEANGVNLNIELLNSKVDHAGYECDNTAWGVKLTKKANSDRVKLLYDIYHMQIMEGDIIRTITESISTIGHFHTAGNPGRHEMNDTQELNYRGICSAISGLEYEGYVGHEFFPEGDILEGLRQAFTMCDVNLGIQMAVQDIIDVMISTHPLDRIPRAGYLLRGVTEPESVAAHSHSLSLLVLLVCEECPGSFDNFKAVKMAVIHDLQEVQTMDIPMPAGSQRFKAAKEETEEEIFASMFGNVTPAFTDLYREFRQSASPEARLVRGLDKVQMMIKVLCYESEGRGRLDDFWRNKANFKTFELPIIGKLFAKIAEQAGKILP